MRQSNTDDFYIEQRATFWPFWPSCRNYQGGDPTTDPSSARSSRTYWFKIKVPPNSMWKKMNNMEIHPYG